jgi:general secretion pathway protein L
VSRLFVSKDDYLLFLIDGATAEVFVNAAKAQRPLGTLRLGETAWWLDDRRFARWPAEIMIPAGGVLRRSIALGRAALDNPRHVLERDIDRLSPFSRDEAYFDFRIEGVATEPNGVKLELVLTPCAPLEPWLAHLTESGLRLRAIRARDAWPEANLLPRESAPPPTKREVAVNLLLIGLVVGLAGLALQLPLWQSQDLLNRLHTQAQGLRVAATEVEGLRQRAERLVHTMTRLGEMRNATRPLVDVVLELTNLLKDDSWVRSLEIKGSDLLLCGESKDSVALAVRLEKSPMFSSVAFRSPVVHLQGTPYQRFQLSASLAVPRLPRDWAL